MTKYLLFIAFQIFTVVFLPSILSQYFGWLWLFAGVFGILVAVVSAFLFAAALSGMKVNEELRGWRL